MLPFLYTSTACKVSAVVKVLTCRALCFKGSSNTSHTSKYFGSVDSPENNHRAKGKVDMAESERLKDVLQDPVWLLGAHTDDSVMMAYQMPSR